MELNLIRHGLLIVINKMLLRIFWENSPVYGVGIFFNNKHCSNNTSIIFSLIVSIEIFFQFSIKKP
jgi:hypothetical protein